MDGNVHTRKKNTETLIVSIKAIGLQVNADKPKYMIVSRDQNVGRSHSIKTDNWSFEMVEDLKYLGKSLRNQTSIQKEIKNRLKSGNTCYHPAQNLCLPVCYPKT